MFLNLSKNFSEWFKNTTVWWFTTLFGRIGILFSLAGFILVFITYYVFNWSVSEKDTIFEIQDAYLHLKLIDSWQDLSDTAQISNELKDLKIDAYIYKLDADTLCENNVLIWSNSKANIDLCNYSSYYDSYQMNQTEYGFDYGNRYLSFGEYELPEKHLPSVFIISNNKKYLLITDFILHNDAFPFLPSVLIISIFMLIFFVVIRRFLAPINKMEKRIIALKKGDLKSKIKVTGKDELALLSTNFNNLIGEVKSLLNQKERLLSEVSHELRTPLAKIRLLLEMIRPENRIRKQKTLTQAIFKIPKFGDSIKKEALDIEDKINKIDGHVKHLDAMITNILLSDQMSGSYTNLEITNFYISKLLKDSIDLSINRNIKNISAADFIINGDKIKLSIVLKNIFDNIQKYANSKKPCEFNSVISKKSITIIIKDFGDGIDEQFLSIITKPFTQGKLNANKGFGLGLSICKKVIEAHNGTFEIRNYSQGAEFKIILPKE